MKKHKITDDIPIIPFDGETVTNEEVPVQDGSGVPNRNGVEAQ